MTALTPGFIIAVMLIAAIAGGYVAKWIRLPRIIGYLVAGIILKQFFKWRWGMETDPVKSLEIVNELALGLILFTIGEVFERRRVKAIWKTLWRISIYEICLTFILTAVGCAFACIAMPDASVTTCIAVGLLLGTVAIATAPAATYLVLREYESKGPMTDHLLGMVGINNLVSIISFGTAFILCTWLGWAGGGKENGGKLLLNLCCTSAGSIAIGIVLGYALNIVHSRLALPELALLFFGILFLLSSGDDWLKAVAGVTFNPMVVCLAMGAVFANTALDAREFENALGTVSMPVFALFFVMAGWNLHIEELSHLGLLGIAYIVFRSGGKVLGVRLGVKKAGRKSSMVARRGGIALLCQAGVAIGLGTFLINNWLDPETGEAHAIARKLNTVILASVALFELLGPMLVKHAVVRAGEVKLMTLLRPGSIRPDSPGVGRRILEWTGKRVGFFKRLKGVDSPPVARHVMRTNVKFLPVGATLDEVLHFVERSHLTDFPVVDSEGKYIGIVHFQGIRDMVYDPTLAHLVTAFDLAEHDAPTVTPDTPLEKILDIFHEHNLGAIPVVDDLESNRLAGIVEQRDLLRALHKEMAESDAEENSDV
ncbi:MAG: CBS domain-containing protein [Planctomycetota bacterium]